MIRFRVEPRPLPAVKDLHLDGVFGNFDDIVDREIAACEKSEDKFDQEKARFFRYLKSHVDSQKFGEMQEFQLSGQGKLRLESDMVKYIDPAIWFDSKLRMALRVGLNRRDPIDILDIGTGPAHFPVVAEFYGHRVIGTDVPYKRTGELEPGNLYEALGQLYKVSRIPLRIEQYVPLPDFGRRFGMVTAFLAAFNVDSEGKPWTIDAWKFFLKDLHDNVLAEGGELFMSLANGKLTDEVWDYLSERAVFTNKHRVIHFTDLAQFA
ncbi:MAG: hypothetical protein JOZ79_13545 [Sphingomonas sp.]|nr:hypothetical protein [Sphingomonas sp.]